MKKWLLGLVVALPALAATEWVPGQAYSWASHEKHYSDFFGAFPMGDFKKVLADWHAGLDREMTPALLDVFTSPDAKVAYGDFTDPEARYTRLPDGKPKLNAQGEPIRASFDGGQGLRVVWQLTKRTPAGDRLASVITFWRFDFAKGVPVLVPGFDSLRIRAQLGEFSPRPKDPTPGQGPPLKDPGVGMAGVSYTTTMKDGAVTAIGPSPAIALGKWDGNPATHRNVTGVTLAVACAACHRDKLHRLHEEESEQKEARDKFLAWLGASGLPTADTKKLEARMLDPVTRRALFTPPGLVKTLQEKLSR